MRSCGSSSQAKLGSAGLRVCRCSDAVAKYRAVVLTNRSGRARQACHALHAYLSTLVTAKHSTFIGRRWHRRRTDGCKRAAHDRFEGIGRPCEGDATDARPARMVGAGWAAPAPAASMLRQLPRHSVAGSAAGVDGKASSNRRSRKSRQRRSEAGSASSQRGAAIAARAASANERRSAPGESHL